MRDLFFNETGVRTLAANVRCAWPPFDDARFVSTILARLADLGLNERNFFIRDTLRQHLPPDYPNALDILVRSLGPECPSEGPESYTGFYVMSLCAFVAEYGLDHREPSLAALREMTKRFSAEFAIRSFLDQHTDYTLATLETWARDPHPQVRRLVSEGSRPRLPWGMRLHRFVRDPRPVLHLLELLKNDDVLFVRRSVANNLNDIAKDHPDLVVATLRRWQKDQQPGTQWLVKHALRTLLKQGHPEALDLLGYPSEVKIAVQDLALKPRRIKTGDSITFGFTLASKAARSQKLMIDYVIHYRKANGQTAPKVFKLTTRNLPAHATEKIEKTHPFRAIGIRPYYPGEHAVEIQINGQSCGRASFQLLS
jgi:3-methyladenine DNA glycosylase AlkC